MAPFFLAKGGYNMKHKDHVLMALCIFASEHYPAKNGRVPARMYEKQLWMQRSYERWAAQEFIHRLSNSANDIYYEADRFIYEMNEFSTRNHSNSKMFSIAYDVGTEMLDYMLTVREEGR